MFSIFKRTYHHLNRIEVSRSALIHNFHTIQNLNPQALVCPVLKSNAYGHGLKQVAPVFDSLHPAFLCVDSLYEAYQLQKIGIQSNILILGYTIPENFKVKPVPFHVPLFDIASAEILNRYQKGISVHLKIDTGMNRFGVRLENLDQFLDSLVRFKHIRIAGVYSHLSSADEPKKNKTNKQIETFKKALAILKSRDINPQWIHISASAGALTVKDPIFNMIRAGLAIYGISPTSTSSIYTERADTPGHRPGKPGDSNLHECNLKPTLEFRSRICHIKQIHKGETVSYNDTFTAERDITIGIIGAGYYEGIDRRLSNTASLYVNGVPCRILGRVCMNITVIDLSNVPNPHVGQDCVVYSCDPAHSNSVEKNADRCGTIPYELLVKLSETVRREVVE